MKKYLLSLFSLLLLAGCAAQKPNLVDTNKPILNITAAASQAVDASLHTDSVTLQNKTTDPVRLAYDIYWYNAQGVTQVYSPNREALHGELLLSARQKTRVALMKPSANAVIYRFYLQKK